MINEIYAIDKGYIYISELNRKKDKHFLTPTDIKYLKKKDFSILKVPCFRDIMLVEYFISCMRTNNDIILSYHPETTIGLVNILSYEFKLKSLNKIFKQHHIYCFNNIYISILDCINYLKNIFPFYGGKIILIGKDEIQNHYIFLRKGIKFHYTSDFIIYYYKDIRKAKKRTEYISSRIIGHIPPEELNLQIKYLT
jgi:hypothetical protein